jgi:hypothetical protein
LTVLVRREGFRLAPSMELGSNRSAAYGLRIDPVIAEAAIDLLLRRIALEMDNSLNVDHLNSAGGLLLSGSRCCPFCLLERKELQSSLSIFERSASVVIVHCLQHFH